MPSKNDDILFSAYLDSIRIISDSESTIRTYRSGLDHFVKFVELKHQCAVTEIIIRIKKGLDVYRLLSNFVVYLHNLGKKPSTVKNSIASVKGLLRHEGIKIYNEDFKQQVKLPKIRRQREEPITKEIIIRLLRAVPLKLQTAILVAIASGMRIGELVQLSISDIDFESKPTRIHIRAETTKTRQSRETFLTNEASKALKDYLSGFFGWKEGEINSSIQNIVIFGRTSLDKRNDDHKHLSSVSSTKNVLSNSLRRYAKKIPELSKLNENGRMTIHFHIFRSYCRTVVGDVVGRDFAEALIGHGFYMDTYYKQPMEKRIELYLKAEPYLTITDFEKIEKNQNKIIAKHREIEEILAKVGLKLSSTLEKSIVG